MLIKYNGEYLAERGRAGGCSKCGTSRSINGVKSYKNTFRTYWGSALIIFEKDKAVNVSDDLLAKWLLTKTYTDENNVEKPSFSKVEE